MTESAGPESNPTPHPQTTEGQPGVVASLDTQNATQEQQGGIPVHEERIGVRGAFENIRSRVHLKKLQSEVNQIDEQLRDIPINANTAAALLVLGRPKPEDQEREPEELAADRYLLVNPTTQERIINPETGKPRTLKEVTELKKSDERRQQGHELADKQQRAERNTLQQEADIRATFGRHAATDMPQSAIGPLESQRPHTKKQLREARRQDRLLRKGMRGAAVNYALSQTYMHTVPIVEEDGSFALDKKGKVKTEKVVIGTPEFRELVDSSNLSAKERGDAVRAQGTFQINANRLQRNIGKLEAAATIDTELVAKMVARRQELVTEITELRARLGMPAIVEPGAPAATTPEAPTTPAQTQPSVDERGRQVTLTPYTGIPFNNRERDHEQGVSRTEKALTAALQKLSQPEADEEPIAQLDLNTLEEMLSDIDGITPAVVKFTYTKLLRTGFIDDQGNVTVDAKTMQTYLTTELGVDNAPGVDKRAIAEQLADLKEPSDKLYAFAIGQMGGLYSGQTIDNFSFDDFVSAAVEARIAEEEEGEDELKHVYDRLVKQGIVSSDGTVRQSQTVLRSLFGTLHGDIVFEKPEDDKKGKHKKHGPRHARENPRHQPKDRPEETAGKEGNSGEYVSKTGLETSVLQEIDSEVTEAIRDSVRQTKLERGMDPKDDLPREDFESIRDYTVEVVTKSRLIELGLAKKDDKDALDKMFQAVRADIHSLNASRKPKQAPRPKR